jgi:hypothetical protein
MEITHKSKNKNKHIDKEFEFYLKNSIPTREIIIILKGEQKDQNEIDAFVIKYEKSKKLQQY